MIFDMSWNTTLVLESETVLQSLSQRFLQMLLLPVKTMSLQC